MTNIAIDQAMQLAVDHHRTGRLAQAEAIYRQVLKDQPRHANAINLLGVLANQMGRFDLASQLIRSAIGIDPTVAGFHNNLGNALRAGGSFDEAAAAYRQAIRLKPDFAEGYVNLSNALSDQELFEPAIAACEAALRINPRYAQAYNNLGCALMDLGKWPQAMEAFSKCLAIEPAHAGARYNYARVLLILGRWKEGWANFDARLAVSSLNLRRDFSQPQWDGRDPSGKTILLHAEGGHGDAINFIRFVPQVARLRARLILECPPALVPLFDGFSGLDRVIARQQPLPEFDFQIPLQSLPHLLGVTLENLPNQVPYLFAPADRVRQWAERTAAESKRRIGLAWSGAKHEGRDVRSRTIDVFAPLADVPNIKFFGLQTGPDAAQPPPNGMDFADYSAQLTDFAETAALIQNLDLVITIDTSVAHLAGAMAKPVWVLIPFQPDFRWLLDRSDTPWYPTMRLFRQTRRGDWATPVNAMVRELRNLS